MTELTPKQEAFCLAYIETSNRSEAYRRAYDVGEDTKRTTVWREAHEVSVNPNVAARINELRSQAAEMGLVSIASITEELDEARVMAIAGERPNDMIKASVEKAKLHGLMVEKKEVENINPIQIVIKGDDAGLL